MMNQEFLESLLTAKQPMSKAFDYVFAEEIENPKTEIDLAVLRFVFIFGAATLFQLQRNLAATKPPPEEGAAFLRRITAEFRAAVKDLA